MTTIKEALSDGSLSLEDEIDYDDTPQAEEIALLKLEIESLNKRWKVLRTYINEMWLDDKGSVRRLQEFVKLLENGDDK